MSSLTFRVHSFRSLSTQTHPRVPDGFPTPQNYFLAAVATLQDLTYNTPYKE